MHDGICERVAQLWAADPFAVRRLLLIYATAEASYLGRLAIERLATASGPCARALPVITTIRAFWADRAGAAPVADPILREAVLAAEMNRLIASGLSLPFKLHPGIYREVSALIDQMSERGIDVDKLEQACIESFGQAEGDPGAERMERLSTLIVGSLRGLLSRLASMGIHDQAGIRAIGGASPVSLDEMHVLDPIEPAELRALAGLPGSPRLTIWSTRRVCAAGYEKAVRAALPAVRVVDDSAAVTGVVRVVEPAPSQTCFLWRDREEDLLRTALLIKEMFRLGQIKDLDRVAVVFSRPLPYVYLARRAFAEAGLPCQLTDTLPLAVEPWAGAVDLALQFAAGGFNRADGIALLSNPLLDLWGVEPVTARERTAALDQRLRDERFISGEAAWTDAGVDMAPFRELAGDSTIPAKTRTLIDLLRSHSRAGDGESEDLLRARAAVLSILSGIQSAYEAAGDVREVSCGLFRSVVRRWIDSHTFAPRTGARGVHLAGLGAARHGSFTHVFVVGLVADEWPRRPDRNIFFPQSFLVRLGWSSEADVAAMQRAHFLDLVESADEAVALSAFTLEEDVPVSVSLFVSLVEEMPGLRRILSPDPDLAWRVADAATASALGLRRLEEDATWQSLRAIRSRLQDDAFRGHVRARPRRPIQVTNVERYLACPFQAFARELRLREPEDVEDEVSALARGRMLHRVMQELFERWDGGAGRPPRAVTFADREEFERLFKEVVDKGLAGARPATELRSYFGTQLTEGIMEKLFRFEVAMPAWPIQRLLEHSFHETLHLAASGIEVDADLEGRIDRLELAEDGKATVIDYKLGGKPKTNVQIALYRAYAERHGRLPSEPDRTTSGAYYAFGEESPRVVAADDLKAIELAVGAINAIHAGFFQPEPTSPTLCDWCPAYTVCRKEIGR